MQEYTDFIANNALMSAIWLALFVMVIVSFVQGKLNNVVTVNHAKATALINREDAKIVDVRSKDEFKKGHIVNAIHHELAQIKNNQLGKVENLKNTPIIVVCNAGISSSQAAKMLVQAGFEKVYNLQGGMTEWNNANLPTVTSKR
ncbi:rhodanese-like domain-containing protein [Ferrimonas lipolytica]|uniref:Rhodanese-like domain-containing protein n=1 Tax=Ferrimonas lipolytica TaxID=2724191 RepID=A0A6H1UGU4_9GAMM|nr:rhodanese-like domain-containing protein [Ferrimonas lipolytica]QIZ78264.1 rhodanese-like domain-containing protein [Ferrimonas lipolytica]